MVSQSDLRDASRVPLQDRLAWTLPQAAAVYGIDYDGHIRREEMDRYIRTLES